MSRGRHEGGNEAEPHGKWQRHSTIEADSSVHQKVVLSVLREHLAFQKNMGGY